MVSDSETSEKQRGSIKWNKLFEKKGNEKIQNYYKIFEKKENEKIQNYCQIFEKKGNKKI